jgi:hypothetical protein
MIYASCVLRLLMMASNLLKRFSAQPSFRRSYFMFYVELVGQPLWYGTFSTVTHTKIRCHYFEISHFFFVRFSQDRFDTYF